MAYHAPAAPHYIPPRGPKPVCRYAEYYRGHYRYWAPGVPTRQTRCSCVAHHSTGNHRQSQHHYCWEEAAAPAAVALPTTVATACCNITSCCLSSTLWLSRSASCKGGGEGLSTHSATQVQEAGGRGVCGKDHRGYAGGALLTWDSANSAIGGGCSASQSFFSHLGKRRLRLAPRLPRLLKAVHVLQVRVLPLTCASVASASRRACPAWLRLFCRSRRCRFSCSCMRVVSSTFWRCSSPT